MAINPSYYAANPYFDLQNTYGSPWGLDFSSAPIAQNYLNVVEPRAAYTRAVAPFAGGDTNFAKWVQSQYARVEDAYKAAVATNPNLTRTDFYGQVLNPAILQRQFQRLGPAGRGEQRANFAPGVHWQRYG